MTESIEMTVYRHVVSNDKTFDEMAKEIREIWAYGKEEAIEYMRTNWNWLMHCRVEEKQNI